MGGGQDEVVDYYTNQYREDLRFRTHAGNRLEWLRTNEILDELLPPRSRVLDVGGGPGAYGRALTTAGHRVRLLDLTPAHVTAARTGEPPVEADIADARALPEADGTYDATLLLGPLYHLLDRDDRIRALSEAARVTRPGGLVLAAAISRFAGPLQFAAWGKFTGPWVERSRLLIDDGVHDPAVGFTTAYFHRAEDLLAECADAGLTDVDLHGVEGPVWHAAEAARTTEDAEAVFEGALELARIYSREWALIAASAHFLAVARV
jgi:SAM-dependent methyltransferase